jgi:hypothetical protein
MGAHSTAWIVHLDRIRGALLKKTPSKALKTIKDVLVPEAKENAEKLATEFAADDHKEQTALAASALKALEATGNQISGLSATVQAAVLQTYVNQLLTYINFTPGATLEAADTGGKAEGRHRGVVVEHESGKQKVPARDLQTAILGLLDVKEATADQQVALLKNHLRIIGQTYPTAYKASGLAKFEHGVLLKKIEESADADAEKSKKKRKRETDKKRPAKRHKGETKTDPSTKTASPSKPAWSPDFSPFGTASTFVSLFTKEGFGPAFFKPLLGSSTFVTFAGDKPTFTFSSQLRLGTGNAGLVDNDGGIPDAARDRWIAAYRRDVELSTAYLTEAEGHTAARYLGITVRLFRGGVPTGWRNFKNPGDGHCLLHSLVQALNAGRKQAVPYRASQAQINELRREIAIRLDADDIVSLCAAAILANVEGTPEPGLGPNVRGLLRGIDFGSLSGSISSTTTKLRSARGESGPVKKSTSGGTGGGGTLDMGQLGDGLPHAQIALLHTGGAHYEMIEYVVPTVTTVGGPDSGETTMDFVKTW